MTSKSADAASGTARELELPNHLKIDAPIYSGLENNP
jgi:hypothetical protein